MLRNIRLPKFDNLATKTANCLLGFDCGEEDNVSQSDITGSDSTSVVAGRGNNAVAATTGNNAAAATTGNNAAAAAATTGTGAPSGPQAGPTAKQANQQLTSIIEKMNAEARQGVMNKKSKGPYFIIFILFILLSAFSLGDDEE